MTINRRLLHWGLFFVTTGAVVLALQAGLVTADGVAAALRLWPALVIALGIGVLLRGTRFRGAGGIVLAIVPGLVLGGLIGAASLVRVPDFDDVRAACVDARPAAMQTQQGTFAGDASVDLDLAMGELTVTTRPGSGWQLGVAGVPGRAARVDTDADGLSVESSTRSGWHWFDCSGDTWRLELPTGRRLDLAAEMSAAKGTLDLAGATLGDVRLVVNAGDALVDLATSTVEDLSLRVNGGATSLTLPAAGTLEADVNVNAGAVQICSPDGLGLRVRPESTLAAVTTPGLVRIGDAWETPGYASAINHADVTVAVNVGSVEINPEGGCK